jgi:hypothetical protein
MPRVSSTLQNVPTNDPNWLHLRNIWERAARTINGNLSFGAPATGVDNIQGQWETFTTPAVGTNIVLTTQLGKPATGYMIMSKSAPVDLFTVGTPTITTLTLQADAAGVNVSLFVF